MSIPAEHVPVWEEPVRGVWAHPGVAALSGIEASRGYLDGTLPPPPIARLTGLQPTDAGATHSTFALPVTRWLLNPFGHVQPGTAALVSDAPLGAAVSNSLPPGRFCTTSELSISYLRPAGMEAERLIAQADVIKLGSSTGLTQAHIFDAHGRLLAHATSRLVLLDFPDIPPTPLPDPEPRLPDDPWQREAPGGVLGPEIWHKLSGREIFEGWLDHSLPWPPAHHLTGQGPVALEDDHIVWTMPTSAWLSSPGPYLYGGALALLADSALVSAVMPDLPVGIMASPLDLRMRFIRPVMAGSGPLTARARVVHRGKGLAVTQGQIFTAEGKVAVLCEASLLLRGVEEGA